MGYAPITRVATAPTPANSGTTLYVTEDTGPILPEIPFVALVWPEGEIPDSGNSEYVQAIGVVGDAVQIVRSVSPIDIETGMMLAATERIPNYERGDTVTVKGHFGSDDAPYTLHLRHPSGELEDFGTAQGVTDDSAGNAEYVFVPAKSGLYAFRWEGESGMLEDNAFFVNYSPAL